MQCFHCGMKRKNLTFYDDLPSPGFYHKICAGSIRAQIAWYQKKEFEIEVSAQQAVARDSTASASFEVDSGTSN